jgi:hypothetical protein
MHDPDLGVAVEGARAAEAEHLLPLGGSTEGAGGPRSDLSLTHRLASQDGPAALYRRADGLRIGVGDLGLAHGAQSLRASSSSAAGMRALVAVAVTLTRR